MDCTGCPGATSLMEIVAEFCGVDLTQIQRLGFQRTQATAPFTQVTVMQLSEWQDYLAATDDTKIVVTPMIDADPVITAGEAITSGGGDNSTLNGVEQVEGVNPSKFTATFKSLSPTVEKQIKAIMCEKRLTVYLFLQGGKIVTYEVTGTPNTHFGLPIQSPFLSDRNNAGFATKDTFAFSMSLPAGWSENISIPFKPTGWNPLTDL